MSARFAFGLLAGSVAALSVALGLRSGPSTAPKAEAAERAALVAYDDALAGPTEAGGAVVVYGMRPGLADIAEGAFPDEVLVTMAEGWVAEMRRLRADFGALEAPGSLAPVAAQLETALTGYVRTAESLLDAARANGEARSDLLERAAALGTEADTMFDTAIEALGAHRARLGLPPDDNHNGGPR